MRHKIAVTPLMLALAVGTAYSQDNAPQRYAQGLYIKVAPGQGQAIVDFYKTGLGSKAIRAMQKANTNITGWSLRQVLYPGEKAPASNYLILTAMQGPPGTPNPTKRDEVYRGATGLTYAQYQQKVRGMSELVGTALFHVHDMTPGYQTDEGDIVVARRLKTAPGKNQEYNQFIRNMRLPLVTERAKIGQIKGFVFSHPAFGAGTSQEWDATESLVYKDLASALPGPTPSGAMRELFAKVHPGKDLAEFQKNQREMATLVRTDVYRVVVVIRPERTVSQLGPRTQ